MKKSNIVLIGMPGSGKSTLGVLLAKRMLLDFVDTDVLIQLHDGRKLQDILDNDGYLALREIECGVINKLNCSNHVVATGGSAVYCEPAMHHLKEDGSIIFLDLDYEGIVQRVKDFATRGIACRPGQSFREVYEERLVLYKKYADITIDCRGGAEAEVLLDKIVEEVQSGRFLRHT